MKTMQGMQGVAVLHSARDDGQLRKLQVAWLTSKPHGLDGAGYVHKINDIQATQCNLVLFLRKEQQASCLSVPDETRNRAVASAAHC